MSEWTVCEPRTIDFDGAVSDLRVRIIGGSVAVVGIDDGPVRLEVSGIDGPPLIVTHRDGRLSVFYEDLPWKGLLERLDRTARRRHATVTLAVPHRTRVELGVVGASAVVSGISGRTTVRGVDGDTTLVGLTGPVRADTVAGAVDAQAVSGDLRVSTVTGDLTVVEGTGAAVRADSVSGTMVLDLGPSAGTDVRLHTVSGEVAVRLPHPADTEVDANTAAGSLSCAFDELRVTHQWGARRIAGRLGAGSGSLKVTTVSGPVALLRRPPAREAHACGSPTAPPPGAPTDRKVL